MKKIPKIIHYCWFGKGELPDISKKYIKGWHEKCPDYKIIEWSEDNFNVNKYNFTRKAYKEKKWAAVSDYVRLCVLKDIGGIYLDTDVEIIKSLNPLLYNKSFLGMEDYGVINNGLIYGTLPQDNNVLNLLKIYDSIGLKENYNNYLSDQVHIVTTYFHKLGFEYKNKTQVINNCRIFSMNYFCPQNYSSNLLNVTYYTYTIHHYFGSWTGKNLNKKKRILFLLRKLLRRVLGTKIFLSLYRKYLYIKKGNI